MVPIRLQARFDASDVVQLTLEEAFVGIGQFAGMTVHEFWMWLGTIQRRNLLDLVSKHLRACRTVDNEVELTQEHLGVGQDSPQQMAEAREEVEMQLAALDRLSDNDRQIILLRRVEALSHAEIAQVLDIQEAAARNRWARAEARWVLEIRRATGTS